ncbi:MAG: tyrosine protein phosphatase [Candidatus Saccharicenans sp.]|nr:tyrosine protein phosphatase [Candidatus Saccharicenans sp.]
MDTKLKIYYSRKPGSEGMIDLHTHLLPDWDDGPESWDEVSRMVEVAAADGETAVCLTPHIFRFSRYQDNQQILEERFQQFYERFGADNRISFFRGAEVFIHPDMVQEIESRHLSVNQSEYVFVEFPSDQVPAGARELFYRLMLAGYTPIISHPERNEFFGRQPEILYDFINRGCLAQLTAGSLVGSFGREVQRRAELFLKHHLVQIMASDAHDYRKRPPVLSRGVEAAARLVGSELAEAMVRQVPEAILNNQIIPELERPTSPLRRGFFFRWFKKK